MSEAALGFIGPPRAVLFPGALGHLSENLNSLPLEFFRQICSPFPWRRTLMSCNDALGSVSV